MDGGYNSKSIYFTRHLNNCLRQLCIKKNCKNCVSYASKSGGTCLFVM